MWVCLFAAADEIGLKRLGCVVIGNTKLLETRIVQVAYLLIVLLLKPDCVVQFPSEEGWQAKPDWVVNP